MKGEMKMIGKKITIDDVMICPNCQNDSESYEFNTDEIEFTECGTGHYYTYCRCKNCGETYKLCAEFEYNITKSWTR